MTGPLDLAISVKPYLGDYHSVFSCRRVLASLGSSDLPGPPVHLQNNLYHVSGPE